jgi:hypothetical protein
MYLVASSLREAAEDLTLDVRLAVATVVTQMVTMAVPVVAMPEPARLNPRTDRMPYPESVQARRDREVPVFTRIMVLVAVAVFLVAGAVTTVEVAEAAAGWRRVEPV